MCERVVRESDFYKAKLDRYPPASASHVSAVWLFFGGGWGLAPSHASMRCMRETRRTFAPLLNNTITITIISSSSIISTIIKVTATARALRGGVHQTASVLL